MNAQRRVIARSRSGGRLSKSRLTGPRERARCYTCRLPLRLTVLLFAITFLASAQIQPHFGFSAGVPLTDTLISSQSSSTVSTSSSFSRYNSVTKRLLIGPAFQLDLIRGFGLEFDALWQRVDSDATTQSTQSTSPPYFFYAFQQTTANRWQFPLLVQYAHALPRSKTRLFLEFGPSISSHRRRPNHNQSDRH